jgi:hypothetical protein
MVPFAGQRIESRRPLKWIKSMELYCILAGTMRYPWEQSERPKNLLFADQILKGYWENPAVKSWQ